MTFLFTDIEGSIESEVSSRPVAKWEGHREGIQGLVLRADGAGFSKARSEGSLMSIGEAAGLVPVG